MDEGVRRERPEEALACLGRKWRAGKGVNEPEGLPQRVDGHTAVRAGGQVLLEFGAE
jgi:hypothetical protein